jgi:hypothetical protein
MLKKIYFAASETWVPEQNVTVRLEHAESKDLVKKGLSDANQRMYR